MRSLLPLLALGVLVGCSGADGGDDPTADPTDSATGSETSSEDTGTPGTDAVVEDSTSTDAKSDTPPGGLPVGCSLKATADLNLRSGPSTSSAVLHVIPSGDTVTLLASLPTTGFFNVSHGGASGWASTTYLDTSACTSSGTDAGGDAASAIATIESMAASSECAAYSWKDRGSAPKGYIEGVSLVFARAVCAPTRSDVLIVSKAKTTDGVHDALAWYATTFSGLSMSNDVAGVDTLRHTYTLLMGLGMRESSGQHCCGRDTSATNTSSDAAEAGAWQTSWDSHTLDAELPKIFARYRTSDASCFRSTFEKGVTCSSADWKNWGTGVDGVDFQKRQKECPTLAAEYAAVMLRISGGSSGHYGPLRTKAAEVRPECDALLKKVQTLVETTPALCAGL